MAATMTLLATSLTQTGGVAEGGTAGNQWVDALVTMDASYATGGEDLTVANLNTLTGSNATITAVDGALPAPLAYATAQLFYPFYDIANEKRMAYDAYATETTAATNLSAGAVPFVCRFYVTATL